LDGEPDSDAEFNPDLGTASPTQAEFAKISSITSRRELHTATATTTVVAVEIRPSARKHGISDDDIRHAINNAIAAITRPGQPGFTMLIGPDSTTRLLEVGVIETENQDYVIHAMTARDKYLIMIEPSGGDPQ